MVPRPPKGAQKGAQNGVDNGCWLVDTHHPYIYLRVRAWTSLLRFVQSKSGVVQKFAAKYLVNIPQTK